MFYPFGNVIRDNKEAITSKENKEITVIYD